jgi:hypothetical protein
VLLPSAQTNNLSPVESNAKWSIRPSTPDNGSVCFNISGAALCAATVAMPVKQSATQAILLDKGALNFAPGN